MAMVTLIIGSVAFFAAGFLAWCTLWHRRIESSLERVPSTSGRTGDELRDGVELGRDSD